MSKLKRQRKVRSSLEQDLRLWQTTFDAINDSVFIIDLEYNILKCNKATLEFFKKSSIQEVVGHSCCELVHGKTQPVEWCPMVCMMESSQRESYTVQMDDKWVEVSADPVLDDDNKIIGAVHLITDITQSKLTEIKLREAKEKYLGLFDSFPHFIGLFDIQGTLLECNIAINKILSRHIRDDLIGLNITQILSIVDKNKELIPKFKELIKQTISKGILEPFEFKIRRSKGGFLWLSIEGSTILIGGVKFIEFLIQDITTRKITEEKLKKSEFILQERVKELGCIYKVSKLIDNPSVSPEGLIYGTIELIPPALRFPELATVRILYENNLYTSINFKNTEWKLTETETANGEEITIEVYYLENKPFLKEDNDLIREIIIRLKSCFEEREAQKKLNESEERYRLIYENANDLIRVLNDRFEFEYLNEKVHERILGYSKEDLIGQTHLPFLHPEDRRHAIRSTIRNINKGEGSYQARFKDKSGIYRWFEFSGTIFFDSKGEKKILSIARDINERKKTELKLKKSEEKYRLISETAYDLIAVLDRNYIYEYTNENALQQILGYSREEVLGTSALKFVHPDDLNSAIKDLSEGFKSEHGEAELRAKHKDGHFVWLEVTGKTFVDSDGELKALLISRDFTKRKIAEEELKKSEERYRLISQNADENLFIFDMNLNVIYNDPNVPNILGYTNDEVSKLKLTDYNEPSSLKILLNAYKEELRNERKKIGDPKRIRIFEIDQIHKDGSIVNVEVKFTFLRDEKGIAKGIISITRDISKRKQAEQKLRESEEKYRLISETAYDLIAILNKRFKYEYINESAFKQILGYSSSDILGKSSLKFVHPDDTSKIAKTLFEGFKEGQGGNELRFKHKEGHWVWIEAKGKTFLDKDGELKAIVISRDVTERKKSEEQLKESETKYREAYNRATFYKDLFGHDMNNILTVINSSADLIPYYLGESEKSKNIRSIIGILQNQVNRGSKLISNVNALTELEESVITIEPVNVNMFLENSIEFIRTSFKERDLEIDVYYSNGSKFQAQANQLLREVFDNILINAIKYNDNSAVEILVKISEEILDNGSFVKLEFIDNGIGVPEERKSMIFKRGNRELKGSKGMGIGLSLVKKILKNYNGKIWVEDKVKGDYSKGSKFVLLIPNFIIV